MIYVGIYSGVAGWFFALTFLAILNKQNAAWGYAACALLSMTAAILRGLTL